MYFCWPMQGHVKERIDSVREAVPLPTRISGSLTKRPKLKHPSKASRGPRQDHNFISQIAPKPHTIEIQLNSIDNTIHKSTV